MSKATSKNEEITGAKRILDRDNWECQVCSYSPPEDSDIRMFATQIGPDETNPDHFETRCKTHHVEYVNEDTKPEDTSGETDLGSENEFQSNPPDDALKRVDRWGEKRFMPQLIAMWPFIIGVVFGGGLTIGGITILNPLRILGMPTWPVNVNPDSGGITFQRYLIDITTEAPIVIFVGVLVLGVTTQIAIWIEPRNGVITRVASWGMKNVKARL